MNIFDRLEILRKEINDIITKNEEELKEKIDFINENSSIKIKYIDIELNNSMEHLTPLDGIEFTYNSFFCIYFFDGKKELYLDYGCFYRQEDKDKYFNLKNKIDELYDKVKLQKDLTEKLKIKETKEKRSKI